MKISVMTLGCPTWDLDTVIKNVKQYGYDGIDFRGLGAELDITKLPAFNKDIEKTKKQINAGGLEVSGISSSLRVCDATKLADNIEEAKRTIPVALGLSAKNVRIFGGGDEKQGRPDAAKIGRDCISQILTLPGADKLSWNFETHDLWVRAADCKLLLDAVTSPTFGQLWDMGQSCHAANEKPQETYALLGPRIRYTHIKDLVFDKSHPDADETGWRYVLPGTGQLPLADCVKTLQKNGYDGWYVFEHEKRWISKLPEPEVAFPAFSKWFRSLGK